MQSVGRSVSHLFAQSTMQAPASVFPESCHRARLTALWAVTVTGRWLRRQRQQQLRFGHISLLNCLHTGLYVHYVVIFIQRPSYQIYVI